VTAPIFDSDNQSFKAANTKYVALESQYYPDTLIHI
jgi:hypothetical protein